MFQKITKEVKLYICDLFWKDVYIALFVFSIFRKICRLKPNAILHVMNKAVYLSFYIDKNKIWWTISVGASRPFGFNICACYILLTAHLILEFEADTDIDIREFKNSDNDKLAKNIYIFLSFINYI